MTETFGSCRMYTVEGQETRPSKSEQNITTKLSVCDKIRPKAKQQ